MEKKHNGIISFWKFMFAMMIVIYHGNIFCSDKCYIFFSAGSIGVEFFFLVSGYLLAKTALNKTEGTEHLGRETWNYIFKKIKTFFPYVFLFYICGLIVSFYYNHIGVEKAVLSIWDFTLLRMGGFKEFVINGVVWYISAMLICMTFLYPLVRKYKKNFIYIASVLIVILLGGWLNQAYGSLRVPDLWIDIGYKGLYRCFFELNLGMIVYLVSQRISELEFTKFGKVLITIIELTGFIAPFVISQFVTKATTYDYLVLLAMSISVAFAFSTKTLEYKFFNNKFFYFLEKLSLPIYLSHTFIRTIVNKSSITKSLSYNKKILLFVILTIAVSYVSMIIIEKLRKKVSLKKLILVDKKDLGSC